MSKHVPHASPTPSPGPGRPKDPSKRAAILDAARTMFTEHGFAGASMDQIAAEAGVSKLTVYSHFGDKATLFAATVTTLCDQALPAELFTPSPETPLRERLLDIGRAFFKLVASPEAIAGHRVLCTPMVNGSPAPELMWEAGPARIQREFAQLLERRIAAGQLELDDPALAASQFFVLLKGDLHARMMLGCCNITAEEIERHLQATVDMFLRAYAVRGAGRP